MKKINILKLAMVLAIGTFFTNTSAQVTWSGGVGVGGTIYIPTGQNGGVTIGGQVGWGGGGNGGNQGNGGNSGCTTCGNGGNQGNGGVQVLPPVPTTVVNIVGTKEVKDLYGNYHGVYMVNVNGAMYDVYTTRNNKFHNVAGKLAARNYNDPSLWVTISGIKQIPLPDGIRSVYYI